MRYLVTICSLFGLLATQSCGRRGSKGAAIDSAFEPFIPPATKVLAGVQIAKLETTPLYTTHKDQLDLPQLSAFAERTGLDPTRDLSEILIAWDGKQALAMARGNFSQSKFEPKLKSLGARPLRYQKYTLFGDDRNSLVFIRDGLALAGSSDAVRAAVDQRERDQAGVPGDLQAQLDNIPNSDQIWVVSSGALPTTGIPMRSEIDSALSNIVGYVRSTATGIGVDTGIHLESDLTCISNPGAQRVRDALRGGIGLARLTTKDNQLDLLRLYDSIHVDQENAAIHVRADLPPDLANKLLAYLPQLLNRARP